MQKFLVALTYIWRVIRNLGELLVILYVFSRLQDRFEIIVVSILGFIYLTIRTIAFGQYMMQVQLALGIDQDFVRIRRLLNDDTVVEHEAGITEVKKTAQRQTSKGYIDIAFMALAWLVCLFQLLTNL